MAAPQDKADTKVNPKKDGRWRVTRSERLWVINRSWNSAKTHIEVCGAIESIERSVYQIDGRVGEWVRYDNRYFPLHSAQEFSELLANASAGKFHFFNNEAGVRGKPETDTQVAPFIYADEPGPIA